MLFQGIMMDANGFGGPTASAVVPEQVPNGVEITADKPELEVILNYLKKHNLKVWYRNDSYFNISKHRKCSWSSALGL